MKRVGLLGAGSWGTALAITLAKNGHKIVLWSALEAEVTLLQTHREHIERLPGTKLPENIVVTNDLEMACRDMDIIVFSVASPYVRSTAKQSASLIREGQIVVNVAKGIEDDSLKTLSEILKEELPQAEIAVLSGPSHAEEVSKGIPTTVVVGTEKKETATFIQEIFMSQMFRVYTSPDIIGIEIGGALKNVIALAAGMIDGLGFGDNTKAALMTRGIAEITRLGVAMGSNKETFSGLTGIGDLIVTCTSNHSRNHNAGYLMGKGYSMEDAMKEVKQVVEGVYSAKAALKLAKEYQVSMPIVEKVNQVLFEGKLAKEATLELLAREPIAEYKELEWKK